MRQLMRQQTTTLRILRSVLPRAKYYVPPNRVRQCIHRPRRLGCLCIGVDADSTEIMPEAWLHERSRGCIERLPSTTVEHSMNDKGNAGDISSCICLWLAALFEHKGGFCLILII